MIQWFYGTVFNAIADFFTLMGNMGAEIFSMKWIQASVRLFTLFGLGLFVAGIVVAVFDLAIDYHNGSANFKSTCLHILMGFICCSLLGDLPIRLYKFCITLQNTFSHDLAFIYSSTQSLNLAGHSSAVLVENFSAAGAIAATLFNLLAMIAFGCCVVKIFFQNIKRGGILLAQIAVGSLYMFSIPRGNTSGFFIWIKQIIAICLTAFLQTTLLYLGLMTFANNMLLGLGIMLAAGEVPNIVRQFGLDTSARSNMMNVVHAAGAAVSVGRMLTGSK